MSDTSSQQNAFGAPGMPPRWTSSTKEIVGTAYSASSRVWWTISHGILNECYYPTIDRPQVRDMELLFTDGETFFHEEKRNFKMKFEFVDPEALAVRITATAHDGSYGFVKEVFSDPHYPVVLLHVKLHGEPELLRRLKMFALMSPHLEVGGEHNNARVVDVAGFKTLLCWKGRTSLAFGVHGGGFCRASCGYVGASDGWQDLQNLKMDWEFPQALDGNLGVMGEIDMSQRSDCLIGLAFGEGDHAALAALRQSLATPAESHLQRFVEQWRRVTTPVDLLPKAQDGGRLLRISHNMLLTHEDKTFAGAFIASASIPWGQAKGDEDLGGYHLVWTRDMVQTATALLACGKAETARRALIYLAVSQRGDGSFAQNFWVDGTPYWGGIQLDEVAFPIVLAWRLWKSGALGNFDVFTFAMRAAGFLVRQAPVTQQERWEENPGYSPSTLAIVISGLICAADIARAHDALHIAQFLEEEADWIESHIEEWCVTSEGDLHPEIHRYYMRIRPPACGEPYAAANCAENMVHIANRMADEVSDFPARSVVDAGFLELVRYGIRRPDDPLVVDSLVVVDHVLMRKTKIGKAWRRYNHDGYGNAKDGAPFTGSGQGGCWPLLGGERAHYELAAGQDVSQAIREYEQFASQGGMLPEQVWDGPDIPGLALCNGRPSGSAMPLVWAHAEYIKLLRSAADGRVYDCIPIVEARYAKGDPAKLHRDIEIFKLRRHVSSIPRGSRLRILNGNPFRVVWSSDGWKTTQHGDAAAVGTAGWYYDLDAADASVASIVFTLFWPQENRWEGTNYTVAVTQ